jgi:hypothetical protein
MVAAPVHAQATKIGFVSTERILRDSKPAKAAQAKIEAEFKRRDDELQKLAGTLRTQAQKFDKDAPVLSESERVKRQRQLADLDSDLQRKRREFQEDFNRRIPRDEFQMVWAGFGDTSAAQAQAFAAAHPDLYADAGQGVRLNIHNGDLLTGSLHTTGFATPVHPDWSALRPLEQPKSLQEQSA